MRLLLAGDHVALDSLRRQFASSLARRREHTGCGFFTYFDLDRSTAVAVSGHPSFQIGDVDAVIHGLRHGAGFILFVENGYLDNLEGYSYDEPWPANDITDFKVSYEKENRDLAALDLGPSEV